MAENIPAARKLIIYDKEHDAAEIIGADCTSVMGPGDAGETIVLVTIRFGSTEQGMRFAEGIASGLRGGGISIHITGEALVVQPQLVTLSNLSTSPHSEGHA